MAGKEWEYLKECLDTNWVSSAGKFVTRFEGLMADYVGVGNGVATINGTAALHMALVVAGVKPGDEVLTSTLTFIATANAVRHAGAEPVFFDADAATWQMDPDLVVRFLEQDCEFRNGSLFNRRTGRRIGAVLPVHILGHPVDMDPIVEAAGAFGVPVIEDATESLGASYKGRKVGSLGQIACFSFNGNKLITCGGGGMIVTENTAWAKKARHLTTQARSDAIEYKHDVVGYNYRLTNIQAAMGCAQFERLDDLIAAKRRIAKEYRGLCGDVAGLSFMPHAPWAEPVDWLSTVLVDAEKFAMGSRDLLRALAGRGIETRPLWQPLHKSDAHAGAACVKGGVAERLFDTGLSLPSSAGLSSQDLGRVVSAIRELSGG